MKLRKYKKEDSAVICSWIQDEKALYQWSADRIGKFPLGNDALNENYASAIGDDKFIPLTACNEENIPMGHLLIRYPNDEDETIVRFGFVIVDPVFRGKGYGRKMLQLAIDYAANVLHASVITLGVFTNNDKARRCYESVGFRPVGETEVYKMAIGEWECIEMELKIG